MHIVEITLILSTLNPSTVLLTLCIKHNEVSYFVRCLKWTLDQAAAV